MIKDHGGSAFPDFPIYELDEEDGVYSITSDQQGLGMTLRDYFAAKAMQGWVAGTDHTRPFDYSRVASFAYEIADAMIIEREL